MAGTVPVRRSGQRLRPARRDATQELLVEVLIRPFRPDDLDGLFVLDYRCYAPPFRFSYQQLLLTLQQVGVSALVIEGERKGDVIGGLIMRGEPGARRAAIVSLMVDPAYRRAGLGARLLGRAADYARNSQWEAVVVPVERENADAAAFLSVQGFTDTGMGQPYFESPEHGSLWRLDLQAAAAAEESAP